MIAALKKLRDLGNTVIVVEHDVETMENADHIIDLGPQAGINGGNITAQGNLKNIIEARYYRSYKVLVKQLLALAI